MPVDLAQARRDVAAQVAAGLGVTASLDPATLDLPCALVDAPERVDALALDYRRWRITLPVRLVAPPSPGAWDWLLTEGPRLVELLGGAQLEAGTYVAGAADLPCVTVTVAVTVTDLTDPAPLDPDPLAGLDVGDDPLDPLDPPPQEATP